MHVMYICIHMCYTMTYIYIYMPSCPSVGLTRSGPSFKGVRHWYLPGSLTRRMFVCEIN